MRFRTDPCRSPISYDRLNQAMNTRNTWIPATVTIADCNLPCQPESLRLQYRQVPPKICGLAQDIFEEEKA